MSRLKTCRGCVSNDHKPCPTRFVTWSSTGEAVIVLELLTHSKRLTLQHSSDLADSQTQSTQHNRSSLIASVVTSRVFVCNDVCHIQQQQQQHGTSSRDICSIVNAQC